MGLQITDALLRRPDGSDLLRVPKFDVRAGEVAAILGPSGSGKTSLLNCVASLNKPAEGQILVDGTDVGALRGSTSAAFRRDSIGVLFQFGELLPELSVEENVALPARLASMPRDEAMIQARGWLDTVGLSKLADREPATLSGGETQRVALARALARRPKVLLADEPTGMLDEQNTESIIRLILEVCRSASIVGVVVTHDTSVATACDVVYRIHDGHLEPTTLTHTAA
ncbi:MAG: ABC transporter ATP-binding protein [Microlunatus sp.]